MVCQSHHFGHELSFQKFSNLGWEQKLHFSNGGISVNLLKWNQFKFSATRKMLEAYQDIDMIEEGSKSEVPQI